VASIFGTVSSLMLLSVPALMAGFRTDKSALQAWFAAAHRHFAAPLLAPGRGSLTPAGSRFHIHDTRSLRIHMAPGQY
jgi:hypothetical protein